MPWERSASAYGPTAGDQAMAFGGSSNDSATTLGRSSENGIAREKVDCGGKIRGVSEAASATTQHARPAQQPVGQLESGIEAGASTAEETAENVGWADALPKCRAEERDPAVSE